jgi:hypothetical protein
MATVINNPNPQVERVERHVVDRGDDSRGMGFVVGLIALVLLAILLFAYGIPALRNAGQNTGPNINIPDQVDVNLNQNPAQ